MVVVSPLAPRLPCQAPGSPCTHGTIGAVFNHGDAEDSAVPTHRSMHMALIVKGGAALPLAPPWVGTLRRGSVLVYDLGPQHPNGCNAGDETKWAILDVTATGSDPSVPRWLDFTRAGSRLVHPPGTGNMACTGHTWTADGRLAIFGGNEKHGDLSSNQNNPCLEGGKHVYLFDPTQGTIGNPPNTTTWTRQTLSLLPTRRWYPSVVLIVVMTPAGLRTRIVVLGGNLDLSVPPPLRSNFLAWEPPLTSTSQQGRWEGGGAGVELDGPLDANLLTFPYSHLMSNGKVVVTRFGEPQATTLRYSTNGMTGTGTWLDLGDTNTSRLRQRIWGCSLLLGNLDANHANTMVVLGGQIPGTTPESTFDVQMCRPQLTPGCWPVGYWWTDYDPQYPTVCANIMQRMTEARYAANAVLLPDGSFLVIGGGGDPAGAFATNAIERYDGGKWHPCASLLTYPGLPFPSGYGFHSTALLLPDGRVLIGAGDMKNGIPRYDYQIYVPWYIACGAPRPLISGVAGTPWTTATPAVQLAYGQTFKVTYPVVPGVAVDKVVLMRPSSVTHGNNSEQRHIELEVDGDIGPAPGEIWVKMPANPPGQGTTVTNPNEVTGPPGHYMLFLVSTGRIPSVAAWVELRLP